MVVTQLVKTSAADHCGLLVGDVFCKFGPYSKPKWHPNKLKGVASLVRKLLF